jgi:chromosome segregation ATPase
MTSNDIFEPLHRKRLHVEKLAEQFKALDRKRLSLQDSIAEYLEFQPEVEKARIENLESVAAGLSRSIADSEVNGSNVERRLRETNSTKVNPLVFWQYFTKEQNQIRSEAQRLGRELAWIKQRLSDDQKALVKARDDIQRCRKRLSDHSTFDLSDAEDRRAAIADEAKRIRAEYTDASVELERIEAKVEPHTRELERLNSELASIDAEIARASRYEQDLSAAANGYQRAMIHQECEAKFGTGSPKHVINDRRGRKRTLENNIPKLQRRIRDEFQKLDRHISYILIDGNNACYEAQSFIGLRAISALLREIQGRYKVTVVFDGSILALLRTDSQGVERRLGASVNTYVAPTETAADEYLLKLAGQDTTTFILSNDRFAEYHDYHVVKSGRVLRFLIADGKMIVNDLDISTDL